MATVNQVRNQHLLWRAAFGPIIENATELSDTPSQEFYRLLIKASSKTPQNFDVVSNMFDGLVKGLQDVVKLESLTKEQKQMIRKQSREDLKNLNLKWLNEMINSEAQLREKVSLFWHGHFACRVINIYFQQQLLDVIRKNALGDFGDILREVSKSPAMLSFLNNQQNKKQHPNENFAREVMELFTMGRGNYSETDIKEAARAFTGWGFNLHGEFVNRPFQHDSGNKIFLGKKGNFDGDDIIDILLEQKQTSKFLTKKIYKYFVNEDADTHKVEMLADRFYQSGYHIQSLLEDIFISDWFYDPKNVGNKIKSPVELLVGIRRLLPMEIENEEAQLLFQRVLGQLLFYPPNVAGWPGGKNWIDSSSLMLRLSLPYTLTGANEFYIKPKDDDDTMMGVPNASKYELGIKQVQTRVDWQPVVKAFETVPREDLLNNISNVVLQTQTKVNKNVLEKYINRQSRDNYIKTAIVELMSTPEYQLC
jgi:uncharacterized protein (DUF1800 family)